MLIRFIVINTEVGMFNNGGHQYFYHEKYSFYSAAGIQSWLD